MNVNEIMTQPAITIGTDAPLNEAIRLMLDNRISGLPVVDSDGRLVGMLTEGDLLRRAETGTAAKQDGGWWRFFRGNGLNADEYVQSHSRLVGDLMQAYAVSVTASTPVEDAVTIMEKKHFKRIPVVQDDKVVGILSRADLLRSLYARLGGPATPADDATILARLTAELQQQPWFSERNITLSVTNGIVGIEGVVTDERVRTALNVAARNASGRQEVNDQCVVVETPTTLLPAV